MKFLKAVLRARIMNRIRDRETENAWKEEELDGGDRTHAEDKERRKKI